MLAAPQDWLGWPADARAFPEALASEIAPIAELADRFASDMLSGPFAQLEAGDRAALRAAIAEMAELGLLGIEAPVARGGAGLSMVECCRIMQAFGPLGGFSVSYVAHSGLATTPIAAYAGDALAATYLPQLLSGQAIGAYCLTEPGSGSDAQAARTRARQVDGGWLLSGTKAWISNGGIADIFIVFAQFDGADQQGLSACVVERAWQGVSVGAEERKLGMHASSTTTVSFDEVFVPEANLIGEIGMGARIAFGTLNAGRAKIGAISIGACRDLLRQSLVYARERRAFGRPIAELAAVKEKLAVMAARSFALEASVYRIAVAIDDGKANGLDYHRALAGRQAEAALIKIMGSETLAYCADEAIQIHGGNGFSEEYAPARAYRDARVQRIYEGTNEVNRGLAVRAMLKRWLEAGGRRADHSQAMSPLHDLVEAVVSALSQSDGRFADDAATPVADLLIAMLEAESALVRASHGPGRPALAALAGLAVIEAQRRALDAALRLPPEIKALSHGEILGLFGQMSGMDRDAAIASAFQYIDDPVIM